MVVLDLTLRDLVYYTVGIIINITLHEKTREKLLQQEQCQKTLIPKLIGVLKDSNIEDFDLSKVSAKALHNITQIKKSSNQELQKIMQDLWTPKSNQGLKEVLESLKEELESFIVSI